VLDRILNAALSPRRAHCRVYRVCAAVHLPREQEEGVERAHILIGEAAALILVWRPLLKALQQILGFRDTHYLVSYRQQLCALSCYNSCSSLILIVI